MPTITQRISSALRAPAENLARGVSDRVERAIFGGPQAPPPPAYPSTSASVTPLGDGLELAQPELMERASGDFLERVAPGRLATGVQQALSSGIFGHTASPRKGSGEIVELYRQSPRLRAASHKVASGVAAIEWQLFARKSEESIRDPSGPLDYVEDLRLIRMPHEERHAEKVRALEDGELDEIPHHPFHKLMERPNGAMSGFAARLVTVLHLDLVGDAFWIVDVDGQDRPVRFWPIPSTWVKGIPTIEEPYFTVQFPQFDGVVPADRMMWFRDVDPGEPYGRGSGLGITLGDEVDVDENAAKTEKAFFENRAIPALLVSLKGASQSIVDRARIKWEKQLQGFKKAYQTYFTGAEINVQRLDTSFTEMGLIGLRDAERDIIIQTWGIPPEKLAIIQNSNRSTIEAADLIWTKEVLVPRLELMRLELQRIVTKWDPRLIVDYVNPVPEDMERRRAVVTAAPSLFKVDEQRALADMSPLEDGEGDAFLVDPTKVYVRRLSDLSVKPIGPEHINAGIVRNDEVRAQLGLEPAGEPWGHDRTVSVYSPYGPSPQAALPAGAPVDDGPTPGPEEEEPPVEEDPGEETPDNPPEPDDADLEVSNLDRNRRAPMREGRRASVLSVKGLRAILAGITVDAMSSKLEPIIKDLVSAFGNETLEALEMTKRFDLQDPKVQEHIREELQDRIGRLMNKTTKDNVRDAIASWDGDDDDSLVESVRSVFDVARVERSQAIAETEGQRSREFATHEALKQSGLNARKEWVAVADSRTREAHLKMDGQMRDLDKPFEVPADVPRFGGSKAQAPGYFGIPGLDIRCRCVSAPVVDLDEGAPDTERAPSRTRLLGAGIFVRGATPTERAELWHQQDQKTRTWESRLADAAVEGFEEQEEAVMSALRLVLG